MRIEEAVPLITRIAEQTNPLAFGGGIFTLDRCRSGGRARD